MNLSELTIDLSRCHFPVRGLGHGRRVGIWVQGCGIHCPGCVVPETWTAGPEHRTPLINLIAWALERTGQAEGITISGGEPFDQPTALLALVSALRRDFPGDILVYSGRPWNVLRSRHAAILSYVDVVVSEPFVAARRDDLPLIGSANQRVNLLTPIARERYRDWRQFPREAGISRDEGAIYLAAIPRQGELTQLARALEATGWKAELTHEPV